MEMFFENSFYFILNMHILFIYFALKKHRKEVPLTFELHCILTCKIRIALSSKFFFESLRKALRVFRGKNIILHF